MTSVRNLLLFKKFTAPATMITLSLLALIPAIALLPSHFVNTYAQPIAPTTFPPPILYKLRNIPSYAITIPFASYGLSNYDPPDVSIPIGMTVIWFNDDNRLH